jgi:hypothetical protein
VDKKATRFLFIYSYVHTLYGPSLPPEGYYCLGKNALKPMILPLKFFHSFSTVKKCEGRLRGWVQSGQHRTIRGGSASEEAVALIGEWRCGHEFG